MAVSPSTGSLDDDLAKLFGDAGPSTQDLARLAEDKKAQGLSGARIIRLALALKLGRLPAIGDVLGVVLYASNPRLSEPAKRQRKAGHKTVL